MQETQVQSLGWEDLVEEDMATHSSILAWRTPRTEEPGGPQSMGGAKSQIGLSNSHTQHTQQEKKKRSVICEIPWSFVVSCKPPI